MTKRLALVLSIALISATPVLEAHARSLGFGRIFRVPGRVLGVGPRVLPYHSLRRTLGAVAVASAGVVILSGLTRRQRTEVAERTNKIVDGDPNTEVSDTYETRKGGKSVKITASPALPPDKWRDDPALKMAVDPKAAPGEEQKTAGNTSRAGAPEMASNEKDMTETQKALLANEKNAKQADAAKGDEKSEAVKLAELPADASCRKVTTELKTPADGKEPEKTESNAALLCKMSDGKWQPATL